MTMTAVCGADPRRSQPQAWAQVAETCLQFLAVTRLWTPILPEGGAAPMLSVSQMAEDAEAVPPMCINLCSDATVQPELKSWMIM